MRPRGPFTRLPTRAHSFGPVGEIPFPVSGASRARGESRVPEHHGTAHRESHRDDPPVPQGPCPGDRCGQVVRLAVPHRGPPAGPPVPPKRERDHGRTPGEHPSGPHHGRPVGRAGEAVCEDDGGLLGGPGVRPRGIRRTRGVHRLDTHPVTRQQGRPPGYRRERGNRGTRETALGRRTHVGYCAAERIRAMQPPGPFVLSERCYADVSTSSALLERGRTVRTVRPPPSGERRTGVRSSAAYSPGPRPGVPLSQGTRRTDVMGERTVHDRPTTQAGGRR